MAWLLGRLSPLGRNINFLWAFRDITDFPTGVNDVPETLLRPPPEMWSLPAGPIFGAVFFGPWEATLSGLVALSYGILEEEGNWPWKALW